MGGPGVHTLSKSLPPLQLLGLIWHVCLEQKAS